MNAKLNRKKMATADVAEATLKALRELEREAEAARTARAKRGR